MAVESGTHDAANGETRGAEHPEVNAVSFSRHAQALLYESFRHAQGNQSAQVHFMHAYLLLLAREGVAIDFGRKQTLTERIRSRRLPKGHLDIPNPNQIAAQFEFWWLNMWDICAAIHFANPACLPSGYRLEGRMAAVGGTRDMSSFTDEEMSAIVDALAVYADIDYSKLSYSQVINEHFLPLLVRVESNFQGQGQGHSARPRTDGGDVHESKMLDHCATAVSNMERGIADPIDLIYVGVAERLDWLSRNQPDNPVYLDYRHLVDSYNANHLHAHVAALHVAQPKLVV